MACKATWKLYGHILRLPDDVSANKHCNGFVITPQTHTNKYQINTITMSNIKGTVTVQSPTVL